MQTGQTIEAAEVAVAPPRAPAKAADGGAGWAADGGAGWAADGGAGWAADGGASWAADGGPRWMVWAGAAWALALAAFYLVQPLRNGPNMVDEGLLVSVLDDLARGKTLHFEVLDLYGPAHWAPQSWAYLAAGERLIGTRLYLLALKLVGLALSVGLAWRLAGRLAAALTYLWLTLLLGVPWQLLQAPYPFLQAWVLALAVYHLMLCHGARERPWLTAVAGGLCGLAVATKLNTGLLLLGGGLFVLAFGTVGGGRKPPVGGDSSAVASPARRHGLPRWLGLAGVALFSSALLAAIWPHLGVGYVLHLVVPVAAAALWTGRGIATRTLSTRALPPAVYGLCAALSAGLVSVATFGLAESATYAAELAAIIAALDYARPMAMPGQPGTFVGFSEAYWPQLGWLASALFLALLTPTWPDRNRQPDGPTRARVGLFVLVSTHGFVIYSRPDESHIYQAVLAVVPLFFVLAASGVDRLTLGTGGRIRRSTPALRRTLQGALVLCTLALIPSLWVMPGTHVLTTYPTPWHSPHLAGIDFRAKDNPHVRPAFFADRRGVDRWADKAARFLRERAEPTDTVLVLTYDELFPFNAGLQPAGGRSRYLLYLLKNGFIDRQRFEALAPGLLRFLIDHPPDWMMALPGPLPMPLLEAVPEFAEARKTRYMPVRQFGHVQLYRRVR